jgi:hypothetical protein
MGSAESAGKFVKQLLVIIKPIELPEAEKVSRPTAAARTYLDSRMIGVYVGQQLMVPHPPKRRSASRSRGSAFGFSWAGKSGFLTLTDTAGSFISFRYFFGFAAAPASLQNRSCKIAGPYISLRLSWK